MGIMTSPQFSETFKHINTCPFGLQFFSNQFLLFTHLCNSRDQSKIFNYTSYHTHAVWEMRHVKNTISSFQNKHEKGYYTVSFWGRKDGTQGYGCMGNCGCLIEQRAGIEQGKQRIAEVNLLVESGTLILSHDHLQHVLILVLSIWLSEAKNKHLPIQYYILVYYDCLTLKEKCQLMKDSRKDFL